MHLSLIHTQAVAKAVLMRVHSGVASAAGSIILNIGEPMSPGTKDRRSNKAPRGGGEGNSSGSTKSSSSNTSVSSPYVKAHPLTSAYYAKDGGGANSAGTGMELEPHGSPVLAAGILGRTLIPAGGILRNGESRPNGYPAAKPLQEQW